MKILKNVLNSRYFLWLILAYPAVWLLNGWRAEDLFYGQMLHFSGELSARLLIVTMAVTPLRLMFPDARWPAWMLRRRRYFGVAAFTYALLHAVIYIDRKQTLALMIEEGAAFSMWTGWLAFLIFAILAITSNDTSVRYLKRAWKKIHRWIYPAAMLTFAHWIFSAFDFLPGLIHLSVLVFLEASRLWLQQKKKSRDK